MEFYAIYITVVYTRETAQQSELSRAFTEVIMQHLIIAFLAPYVNKH